MKCVTTTRKPNARDRILRTAAQLFHERGYGGVGINEIIEKAETAKATFYHHFPTKESLCEAWLEAAHENSECNRQKLLEGPGTAIDKLDLYFSKLGEYLAASDFRGCPYSNTATVTCTGGGEALVRQVMDHKLSIRDFFRKLAMEFSGSEERAREVGDSLFLLYSGATTEAQNLRVLWPVEAAKRTARELCEAEKCR